MHHVDTSARRHWPLLKAKSYNPKVCNVLWSDWGESDSTSARGLPSLRVSHLAKRAAGCHDVIRFNVLLCPHYGMSKDAAVLKGITHIACETATRQRKLFFIEGL